MQKITNNDKCNCTVTVTNVAADGKTEQPKCLDCGKKK